MWDIGTVILPSVIGQDKRTAIFKSLTASWIDVKHLHVRDDSSEKQFSAKGNLEMHTCHCVWHALTILMINDIYLCTIVLDKTLDLMVKFLNNALLL